MSDKTASILRRTAGIALACLALICAIACSVACVQI